MHGASRWIILHICIIFIIMYTLMQSINLNQSIIIRLEFLIRLKHAKRQLCVSLCSASVEHRTGRGGVERLLGDWCHIEKNYGNRLAWFICLRSAALRRCCVAARYCELRLPSIKPWKDGLMSRASRERQITMFANDLWQWTAGGDGDVTWPDCLRKVATWSPTCSARHRP